MSSYNPLEKENLAESIVDKLLTMPISPLEALTQSKFEGAGVYAIYYAGDFEAYAPYKNDGENNVFDQPTYVGKAIPKGGRKGGFGLNAAPGYALHDRLKDHLNSVQKATNLNSKDFYFRYLTVDDIWIPLGESLLITRFQPIWNVRIDGFGNHNPGSGRKDGRRPAWDTIHPGRTWAEKLPPADLTSEEFLARLSDPNAVLDEVES